VTNSHEQLLKPHPQSNLQGLIWRGVVLDRCLCTEPTLAVIRGLAVHV
jgi:hypothetical protein